MTYRVTHTTVYTYGKVVSLCHNLAHLTPRNSPFQECFETDLTITPEPAVMTIQHEFCPFVRGSTTLATTPLPKRTRRLVPMNSAR